MKNQALKTVFLVTLFTLFCASFATSQEWLNTASRINLDPVYKPFYHGVASGDPLSDRVIIWTRVTPDTNTTGSVAVSWRIATDTNFTQVINSGTVTTTDSVDYTVKVDVTGLQPATWYYYDFHAFGYYSLIGRTKTAPTGDNDSVRFAVVSCSSYEHGYFNAYERIASRNDVDAILHLGDYIYEYAAGSYTGNVTGRDYEPTNEILTLTDYRTRQSQYHLDPDLRFAHQQYPWINVWDDHETANNSWTGGAENHDSLTEGDWTDRKSAAIQAYFEWLPIRPPNLNNNQQIYRKISYGNLLDLLMIDTRLEGRDEPVGGILVPVTDPVINDTNRTLLGADQYNWLVNNMDSTNAQWKIIGQQVMIAPMEGEFFFVRYIGNPDQWDGYRAERSKLLNDIMNKSIENVVVLTGDIHTSWANDIPLDTNYNPITGAGSVGVEFVTTSITSASFDFSSLPIPVDETFIKDNNTHVKFVNLEEKGYLILDINKTRTQADWYYVDTVAISLYQDQYVESWYVNDQQRFLNGSSTASSKPGPLQPHAPLIPVGFVGIEEQNNFDETVLFGIYPNPFNDQILIEHYNYKQLESTIELIDVLGKIVLTKDLGTLQKGLHFTYISTARLPAGNYIVVLTTANQTLKWQLIKH